MACENGAGQSTPPNQLKAAHVEIEFGKLLVLLTAMIGSIVLMAIGNISEAAGMGMLGTCLGYTVGNGVLASKGKRTVPMIGASPDRLARPPVAEAD